MKIGERVEFRIDQCVSSRMSRGAAVLGFRRHELQCIACDAVNSPDDWDQLTGGVQSSAVFTAHCVTADANKALIDGALAMTWTCVDMPKNGT